MTIFNKLIFSIFLLCIVTKLPAQNFITRGKIQFEKVMSNKLRKAELRQKYQSQSFWIDEIPDYGKVYFDLSFTWNESVYKYNSASDKDVKRRFENANVFINTATQQYTAVRNLWEEDPYLVKDSIVPIKWKLLPETRKIIGFECRKAVGIIHKDMYVVAFYTNEIVPKIGPELFGGLPGMILGVAVPQWNTTWFATKLELASFDETTIVPPTLPKKGKPITLKEMASDIYKKHKDNFSKTYTADSLEAQHLKEFHAF